METEILNSAQQNTRANSLTKVKSLFLKLVAVANDINVSTVNHLLIKRLYLSELSIFIYASKGSIRFEQLGRKKKK